MPKSQLVELYAKQLGVIEEARVTFGPGFNVITGETGAGKTLLLGALELSLGGDSAASRYAVTTETRAVALFESEGKEQLFAREASSTGRLRSTLDGAPANVESLRESAKEVIVIHGQHDSLTLRNRSEVVRLIDNAGSIDTSELIRIRTEIRDCESLFGEFGGDAAARDREIEFLRFQTNEISSAHITDDDELSRCLDSLASLTSLVDAQSQISEVVEALDGDSDLTVLTAFASALQRLPHTSSLDAVRTSLLETLENAREGVRELRALCDPDAIDHERLNELSNRVTVLQNLVRKYGPTLSDVRTRAEIAATQAKALEDATAALVNVEERLIALRRAESEEARKVLRAREFASVALTEAVREQLPRVALPHASLRFVVDGVDGSDAQILFSPNPGQAEGPLQSLASGGELSRVLLALSLVADRDHLVSVFDEIDAGIGGQVAQQIGSCLAQLGETQQVIAVTHLPSVAAKASHHFVIQKNVERGRTVTTVTEVTGPYRVREIARMLVGDAVTEEAVALAQRLLSSSN